jgi:hypothetical protein
VCYYFLPYFFGVKPMSLRVLIALVFFITGSANAASGLEKDLLKYNQLQLSQDAKVVWATDNGEIAAFRNYRFECRHQSDFESPESPEASAALGRFLSYFAAIPSPSINQKKQRLALLKSAIAAGSWRADYLDAIWGLWDNRGRGQELQPFVDRLYAYADKGLPIAIYAVVEWNAGMYDDIPKRVSLLKAAIERGNPNAMASVGHNLGTHDLALRPMALQMLECAAAQGEPMAYEGLGRIAWQEGRWVDAYRTWIKGANLGCDSCLQHVESTVATQPGHRPSDGTYNTEPKYKALRKHFEDQYFFYGLTHLGSLRIPAPPSLQIDVDDKEIIREIKSHLQTYGTP